MGRTTPRSEGVFLNENEIRSALALNWKYQTERSLDVLAADLGIQLEWLEDWGDSHGIFEVCESGPRIWLPRSNEFKQCLTFGHEVHHFLFAPRKRACIEMGELELARWEGKATSYGALFVAPILHAKTEAEVYRFFGEEFKHAAYYRIQHIHKHGW